PESAGAVSPCSCGLCVAASPGSPLDETTSPCSSAPSRPTLTREADNPEGEVACQGTWEIAYSAEGRGSNAAKNRISTINTAPSETQVTAMGAGISTRRCRR